MDWFSNIYVIRENVEVNKVMDVVRGEPVCVLVGMQTGAAPVESRKESPQKIKNGSAF